MDNDVTRGLIVFIFGAIGVIVAYLEQIAYAGGYLVDEYTTGSITLPDLQIMTIVLILLIGVIVAVVAKK